VATEVINLQSIGNGIAEKLVGCAMRLNDLPVVTNGSITTSVDTSYPAPATAFLNRLRSMRLCVLLRVSLIFLFPFVKLWCLRWHIECALGNQERRDMLEYISRALNRLAKPFTLCAG